ncbi:MAG: hypothetical protein ACJAWV_003227, partial [Flammeovirgaceae bacterium]
FLFPLWGKKAFGVGDGWSEIQTKFNGL